MSGVKPHSSQWQRLNTESQILIAAREIHIVWGKYITESLDDCMFLTLSAFCACRQLSGPLIVRHLFWHGRLAPFLAAETEKKRRVGGADGQRSRRSSKASL
jgi:hypothetical protein